MITLSSVDVTNVRSIAHGVFNPLGTDEGSTALVGKNGAGKSTVLTALMWALYGVLPEGTTSAGIRRQHTVPGEDACQVVVTFTHDGQTIRVERGLKTARDVPYVKIWVDDVETAFGKIRAAEAWIESRLQLTKDAFLTAFVVRQKELDGLIKAKPAERRALIERLAGIDRLEAAVKAARAEQSDANRILEQTTGSDEAVADAAARVTETSQALSTAEAELQTLTDTHAALTEAEETATKTLAGLQDQRTAHQRWNAATSDLRTRLEVTRSKGADLQTQITEVTERSRRFDEETYGELLTQHSALQTDLSSARGAAARLTDVQSQHQQATARHQSLLERLNRARTQAADARTHLQNLQGQIDVDDVDDATIEKAETVLSEARTTHSDLSAEFKRLTTAIVALRGVDASCPTCATPLEDPASLIATLQGALERTTTDGHAAKAAVDAADQALRGLQAARASRQQIQSQITAATSNLAQHEENLTALTGDEASAKAEADQQAAALEQATTQSAAATTALAALPKQIEDVARRIRDMEADQQAAAGLGALTAQHTAVLEEIATTEQALADLPRPDGNDPTDVDLQAATTAAQQARTVAGEHQRTINDVTLRLRDLQHTHTSAETAHTAAVAQRDARTKAAKVVEEKATVTAALADFRRDRVARIAPELSETATDLLSLMTDGKFTSLTLDEQFTPSVTDATGAVRDASWLSGGEESAVALALRIAIGELIAGQHGGLLWLDEVLTAQDEDRRPAMARAISDLRGRQIIWINHVAEATDMVDRVVEVVGGPDGSRLVAPDEVIEVEQVIAAV